MSAGLIPYVGEQRIRRDGRVRRERRYLMAEQLLHLAAREDEVRELLNGDLPFVKVADALGVSRSSLGRFMGIKGIVRPWRWAQPGEEIGPSIRRRPTAPSRLRFGPVVDEPPRTLRVSSGFRAVEIRDAVCKRFGLTEAQIISASKPSYIAYPRMLAMMLTRELTRLSFPDIGRRYGGRDHTTAIHAYRKVSARIKTHPDWAEHYNALRRQLTAPPANDAEAAE